MPGPTPSRPTGPDGRLFFHRKPTWEQRKPALEALVARFPAEFKRPIDADAYLSNIRMPASLRWAYKSNDKAGSSSVKRFLFQLEFGVPLTVAITPPTDINEDAAPHHLAMASLFLSPDDVPGGIPALLDGALRLATVRDPATRAVSSFTYLCRSQEKSSVWFANDRLRLSALTGFDWTRHMHTVDGFLRFIDYVEASHHHAAAGGLPVNTHWLSQVCAVRPDLFRPDIVGRTENLPDFFSTVAQRLGHPPPQHDDIPHTNRQPGDRADTLLTPATRSRIAQVYAADYQAFGYDP